MVQRVERMDRGSPADTAGLRVNDRIVELNGLNVETDAHHELMQKITAAAGRRGRTLTLLVVDPETDKFFHDLELPLSSTQPFVQHCPATHDLADTNCDAGKNLYYQPL